MLSTVSGGEEERHGPCQRGVVNPLRVGKVGKGRCETHNWSHSDLILIVPSCHIGKM